MSAGAHASEKIADLAVHQLGLLRQLGRRVAIRLVSSTERETSVIRHVAYAVVQPVVVLTVEP